MGTSKLAGFTIIETMLVLAISGVLIVTMLVGASASLNTQRYRDAAETLKSLVQKQYSSLSSVQNGRSDNLTCGSNATPVSGSPTTITAGQSKCLVIGKYLRIENSDITNYTVLAYQTSAKLDSDDDIKSLQDHYNINVDQSSVEKSTMEWGTRITWPTNQGGGVSVSPRSIGILFLRSPDSGQIYTFTNSNGNATGNSNPASPGGANISNATLKPFIKGGLGIPGQASQVICVDSTGLFASNDQAVYIDSYASSGSAVELRSNEFMAGGKQC